MNAEQFYKRWQKLITQPYGGGSGDCCPKSVEKILSHIGKATGITFTLDVGAGGGGNALKLIEKGYAVRMCDLFPAKSEVEKCDMHDLHYLDGVFDVVFCSQTLEHSIAPFVALAEFNRVLKPNGVLLGTTPNAFETWLKDKQHFSCLNTEQWRHLFEKAGFSVSMLEEFYENDNPSSPEQKMILFVCRKEKDLEVNK